MPRKPYRRASKKERAECQRLLSLERTHRRVKMFWSFYLLSGSVYAEIASTKKTQADGPSPYTDLQLHESSQSGRIPQVSGYIRFRESGKQFIASTRKRKKPSMPIKKCYQSLNKSPEKNQSEKNRRVKRLPYP